MESGYTSNKYPEGAASGVASLPKKDTLYEQLLAYHNENDSISDDSHARKGDKAHKSFQDNDYDSMNDKKPAARPTPSVVSKVIPPTLPEPSRNYFHAKSSVPAKKPGIVSVNQPAIHPNSAMYHAAYGGGDSRPKDNRHRTQKLRRSRSPKLDSHSRGNSSSPELLHSLSGSADGMPGMSQGQKSRSRSPKTKSPDFSGHRNGNYTSPTHSQSPPLGTNVASIASTNQGNIDKDYMLAMELSKAEALGISNRQVGPPKLGRISIQSSVAKPNPTYARPDSELVEDSISDDELYPPRSLGTLESSFAKAARREAAENDSLEDVLLALRISAEEEAAKGHSISANQRFTQTPTRKKSTSIQELLALERTSLQASENNDDSSSVMDLVAAGIEEDALIDPKDQKRLLEQIRLEQERKELELALEASRKEIQVNKNAVNSSKNFFRNQQRAMEELTRQNNRTSSNSQRNQSPATIAHEMRREQLIQRGTSETQKAISSGKAQVVICRGCHGRLQAPKSYSLVFCPKCQTISPA